MKKLLLGAAAISFALTLAIGSARAQENFSLKTLDGETVSTATTKDQVTVLAVTTTWLTLSKETAAAANKIARLYGAKGVNVYFVVTDSSSPKSKNFADDAKLRAFAQENKLNVKMIRDADGAVIRRLGVDQMPTFIIIGKDGKPAEIFGGVDTEADAVNLVSEKLNVIVK